MIQTKTLKTARLFALAGLALSVSACAGTLDRLSSIGAAPELSRVSDPTASPGYKPVSMPMPSPVATTHRANSLWKEGSRAFFKDQRASEIGDLITVVVEISDGADISNSTTRTRANTNTADINGLFGYEGAGTLGQFFPENITGANLVDLASSLSNKGTGEVDREEEINFKIAAVVTQRLPNGNMVLYGRQEVRVNFEVREIVVAGVIRPQDISSQNTVTYDKMAEARIAYGGRGQITDMQQPRFGSQVLDILLPF